MSRSPQPSSANVATAADYADAMLTARMARTIFAFALMLILLLVFPLQAFLNNQDLTAETFKVPGVLYNWNELTYHGHFENFGNGWFTNWVRFLLAPIIAIVLVFTVLLKSGHGLRMALGEETGSKKRKDD